MKIHYQEYVTVGTTQSTGYFTLYGHPNVERFGLLIERQDYVIYQEPSKPDFR